EIVNPDGTPVVETFRIPTINKASLYHESKIPGVTEPLTEQSLRSLNKSHSVWKSGPYQQHERFLAQNRFNILTFVMHCYNNSIDRFHELSLKALCTALISLNESGFSQSNEFKQLPMISLFPSLIVEMLVAVYFAMFNGQKKAALAAIQVAHQRASFELYSDVLLITNAMINSYHRGNFSFDNHEVNIEAQKTAHAVKHRITNASFKATKLPDDIDIVEEEESPRLSTVDEDQEHSLAKNIKAKLRNKLGVDKNKNRETSRRNSDTPSMKSGSGSELTDGLGVIVRSGGGNSGIVVDMLEMQPLKDGPDRDKNQLGDGKHSKSSPSPSVLSKKSGLKKTLSGSDTTGKGQSHTLTTSYSSSSSLSPNPVSANGRASSASLIGSSHSKNSSPLNKSNYLEPSYRAHSEGPVISSLSSSTANQKENELASCSNLSEPTLHTTLSPAHPPPSSLSTHSIPAEVLSGSGSEKPAKKQQLVNRNSCSTNL
ncbi:hyccin, partial [Biomphalaria glabrata]